RSHENAARLKGEVLTEHDKRWNQALYEHTRFEYVNEHVPALTSAIDPDFQPSDPDLCISRLIAMIPAALGRPSRRGRSTVKCACNVSDWKVVTEFAFDRKDESLSFEYQFIRKDGVPISNPHPAQGPFPRTMLFFYGLGFSSVDVPAQKDVE